MAADHGSGRHRRARPGAGRARARLASDRCRPPRAHLRPGRGGYLYVIDGRLSLNGDTLKTGDAAKVTGEARLELSTDVAAEIILIDVPLQFTPVGVWAGER